MPNTAVEQLPEGVKVIDWDSWPNYPTWKTEKQLSEMGLLAWGNPVGAVWYSNKYLRRAGKKGHYLMLYDETIAQPKPVDEKKKAAAAKAKATAKLNRTCSYCNRIQESKIDRKDRICGDCVRRAACIRDCQRWLNASNAVILDTETTGLYPGDSEIIQIAVIDMKDNLLLSSYVKPVNPIQEEGGESLDYYPYYRQSAFEVNGITNEKVKDAPTFPELHPKLCEVLNGKLVICYNSEFDIDMIEGDCKRHNLSKPSWEDTDCAMLMYADYAGEWSDKFGYVWHTLSSACSDMGVHGIGAHFAAGDCGRTLRLIQKIAEQPAAPIEAKDGTTSN